MLPEDPAILLSFINMKLRDRYPDLDSLCEDLDEDRDAIVSKLEAQGYHYDPETNCFR